MDKEQSFEKMAEAVENYLQLYGHPHMTIIADLAGIEVVEGIKAKPFTVDPVKHGHWIVYPTLVSFLRCSQCRNGVGWDDDKKPNYCPHCGARMDVQ